MIGSTLCVGHISGGVGVSGGIMMPSGCGVFNKPEPSVCPGQSAYLDRLSFDLGMIPAPCQRRDKGHLGSTKSQQGSPGVCFADSLATWPANGVILSL